MNPRPETDPASVELRVREMTSADAEQIAGWHYDGPWHVYNLQEGDPLPSAAAGYSAVCSGRDGELVGFMCVGAEARVPGLPELDGIIDIGVGMRADLVGQGLGRAFGAAVLDAVRQRHGSLPLRVVVQAWNERSLRLARGLGFRDAGIHECVQDDQLTRYIVLIADATLGTDTAS